MILLYIIDLITFLSCFANLADAGVPAQMKYKNNWESLDSRPLPPWFDEARIGIFLHWGVYSVPSFYSEWFWHIMAGNNQSSPVVRYMSTYYPKNFTYPDFAKDFRAEFFNATEWADMFAQSGAKYVVMTSKHLDGYAMWPSCYSDDWNVLDVGPERDLLGELAAAVRKKNLRFGIHHSLGEWFDPIFKMDRENNFTTRDYVTQKLVPEMTELVELYEPSIIWANGYHLAPDKYWGSTDFLAWLYNESPVKDVVVANDRWGKGTLCHHGDFFSCIQNKRKWEEPIKIDKQSWAFRRDARLDDFLTTYELISILSRTVSRGGNLLINVGPTKDGIITPIHQERLRDLGEWLEVNGEAIYGTKEWSAQNDALTSDVWYTTKGTTVYAIVLFWPDDNVLEVASANTLLKDDKMQVSMLGRQGTLKWASDKTKAKIFFPDKSTVRTSHAYVLKFQKGSGPSKC